MRQILKIIFILIFAQLATTTFLSKAMADGFVFEPYFGLESGDVEQGSASDNFSGSNIGLRAGGVKSRILFGFEFAKATLDVENTGHNDELKTEDLGVFIGYTYQPLRIWMTYWMSSEADSNNSGGTFDGKGGFKVGIGFALLGSMHLNLEKTLRNYSEFEGQSLNQDVDIDGTLLSLSLPFNF